MPESPLISVEKLRKEYGPSARGKHQPLVAVRDVSFEVRPAEIVAIVGESGSGKTTVAKLLTGIELPTQGKIQFHEQQVARLRRKALQDYRRQVQMVFQDPYAALNPFNSVEYTLMRPLVRHLHLSPAAVRARVRELLNIVQLTPEEDFLPKRPDELSGGQRQRVVIARAIATSPALIVADEPVSMLDVSIRSGVLQLLDTLRSEQRLAIVYITHDLLSARLLSDRVMVMYRGSIVEEGTALDVISHPLHPYTQHLVDAIPHPKKRHQRQRRVGIDLATASASAGTETGCPYYSRCPVHQDRCLEAPPALQTVRGPRHRVACYLHEPAQDQQIQ